MDKYIDYLLHYNEDILEALIDIEENIGENIIYNYLVDIKEVCPRCFCELSDIISKQLITEDIYEPIIIGYECTHCGFKHILT